jgi:hypothetical protein
LLAGSSTESIVPGQQFGWQKWELPTSQQAGWRKKRQQAAALQSFASNAISGAIVGSL